MLSSVTKSSAKKKYFYGRQKNHKTLKNVAVNTGSQVSQEFEEENPATFPSKLGEREGKLRRYPYSKCDMWFREEFITGVSHNG